VKYS